MTSYNIILVLKNNIKKIVLKKVINQNEAISIIDNKKTSVFKSLLKKPKKEDVHVDSINLNFECLLMISGQYIADYFRKEIHTIAVDSNVKEIILGGGIFPIKEKSGFKRALVGNRGKNKIEIPLEEHVYIEEEDELVFDQKGREIKFPYKINSKTIENYPDKILSDNSETVKNPQISYDDAKNSLIEYLKKALESDIRELNDEFVLKEIKEVYVPIYEARLMGPKNKVGLLRLDAIRKKFL